MLLSVAKTKDIKFDFRYYDITNENLIINNDPLEICETSRYLYITIVNKLSTVIVNRPPRYKKTGILSIDDKYVKYVLLNVKCVCPWKPIHFTISDSLSISRFNNRLLIYP